MQEPTLTPFRQLRLAAERLSLNEVSRRSKVPAWRLSLIERGMPPTPDERSAIMAVLLEAVK